MVAAYVSKHPLANNSMKSLQGFLLVVMGLKSLKVHIHGAARMMLYLDLKPSR